MSVYSTDESLLELRLHVCEQMRTCSNLDPSNWETYHDLELFAFIKGLEIGVGDYAKLEQFSDVADEHISEMESVLASLEEDDVMVVYIGAPTFEELASATVSTKTLQGRLELSYAKEATVDESRESLDGLF